MFRFFVALLVLATSVAFLRFVCDWSEGVGVFAKPKTEAVSADVVLTDSVVNQGILLIPAVEDPRLVARRALENMDPMDLADVYAKFIKRVNPRLSEEEVELIAGLYADQEFDHGN